MDLQLIHVHIRGLVPTMMSNGRLANPMDKFAKAIAEIKTKPSKKRTDSDYEEIARLEFMGSLYLDDGGFPSWPGENIEGMLSSAAKKERFGKDFRAGLQSDGNWRLLFDTPDGVKANDLEALFLNENFRDTRRVKGKTGMTTLRTRPIFHQWELKFSISHRTDVVNKETVMRWVEISGSLVGLSDFRPKYGRFEVVSMD